MTGKHRHLTGEERQLWNEVVKKARPLNVLRVNNVVKHEGASSRALVPQTTPRPFRLGELAPVKPEKSRLFPDLDSRMATVSPNMDKRNFDRLKKGKLKVEGRIDLHGMTQAEAHPALIAYIRQCQGAGKRLILVITGKGKTTPSDGIMPTRRGILRHAVPDWLQQPGIAPHILQVTKASRRHGGSGAYYVYLRRRHA